MSDITVEDRVRNVSEPLLEKHGLYLVEAVVRGSAASRKIELFVDGDEGTDVRRLAAVSREIGLQLDVDDVIEGRYTLDVSSPGVDRPLQDIRQYRKNIGRPLKIRFTHDGQSREVLGKLSKVDEKEISLEVDGAESVVEHDSIEEARVVLPW